MKNCSILRILICLFLLLISTIIIFFKVDKSFNSVQVSFHKSQKNDTQSTYLAVVILSAELNFEKRKSIRNTWLKLNPISNFKHVFVLGGKNKPTIGEKLKTEMLTYNDILYLENVPDTYDSLASKLMMSFVTLNKFWKFKFLLKCDDDSFVRLPSIVDELQKMYDNVTNLYWGFFDGSASVKKAGRWKETGWNLCDRYLPYALGGGYVLSQDLTQFVANNYKRFKGEDVSLGLWLAPLNMTRVHDPRFDTEYISRGCSNLYLVTHKQGPDNMKNLYNNIIQTGNLCETEFKLRMSYIYNWTALPSKCCRRSISIP